ncbi:16S rRNA (guanine(966)-N(2))-methyltransferase RsmD [Lactobacillus sp. DCY120]|uniref:16S rRNA (Guanine(966)-N(2))-methyltransferase RsmD n=1 Tax=Bombilactobacillus apium TaxID=2675299 RepID=A0A850R109_9LACO|nr:16S rRNA (guanine(966)-N(2))-methyltransferase RsmD [Bombilactobacillus apium]NVY95711.1 16S rRNA (guanine(966)-N(2))-methyltransferase RsmD [Bombilactobacillus apium]
MRVVGGQFRGLNLQAVKGQQTRPTSDKVKESIFNILTPYLRADMTGLDLFAGTGALGIEAYSRGIKDVYLVDKSSRAIAVMTANVQKTHQEVDFTIWKQTAAQALNHLAQEQVKLGLLLLDPPYRLRITPQIVENCLQQGLLKQGALIMLETDYLLPETRPSQCQLVTRKQYGQTFVEIWQYQGEEDD